MKKRKNIMEEKKKKLGTVTTEENEKERILRVVSVLVGNFVGNRRVIISQSEADTYVIQVRKPDEDGKVVEHVMHLSRESFSALLTTIHLFLQEEKEDEEIFAFLCMDDDSGYLYKHEDDLEEEFR